MYFKIKMGKIDIKNIKRLKMLSELIDNKRRLQNQKNDMILYIQDAIYNQNFMISRQLRYKEKDIDRKITCIDYNICILKSDEH